jgi:homoserine kinase
MQRRIFRIKIPASTSNIGPGFDTLGLALKIYNEIEVLETNNENFHIEYAYPLTQKINPNNDLYLKAYKIALYEIGAKIQKFHARIKNRIPVGQGLGSSGSAVIGGVITAFVFAGEEIDINKVLNIAIKIEQHPDNITPSLVGGFTVSSVVNNKVYFKKVPVNPDLHAVVVIPDFTLPTKNARKVLPKRVNLKDVVFNLNRTAYLVSSFMKNDLKDIQWAFYDRIHQPARSRLVPGLKEVIEKAHSAGAEGAFLSGAGPSVVALCKRDAENIGKLMVRIWKNYDVSSRFIVTGIDNQGVRILK